MDKEREREREREKEEEEEKRWCLLMRTRREVYFHQAGKKYLWDEKIHHESLNTFPSPTFPSELSWRRHAFLQQ